MQKLLDECVKSGLLTQNGTWYYKNGKKFGQNKTATQKIIEMSESGEINNPEIIKLIESKEPDDIIPNELNEIKPESNLKLEPVSRLDKVNPVLTDLSKLPDNLDEIFAPIVATLGDIEHHKKGGRFRVFIFGVDRRLEKHPFVKSCVLVFRHNDKKSNIDDGQTIQNEGWTVTSKKLIKNDPRTGKKWLTVARDDTPAKDYFSVGNYVLCSADKAQFKRKKAKMVMRRLINTAKTLDDRQENSLRMAELSKIDPAGSMSGYTSANQVSNKEAKEHLKINKNFTTKQADQLIDGIDNLGNGSNNPDEIDAQVESLRKLADQGKIGNSVKRVVSMPIN